MAGLLQFSYPGLKPTLLHDPFLYYLDLFCDHPISQPRSQRNIEQQQSAGASEVLTNIPAVLFRFPTEMTTFLVGDFSPSNLLH